MQESGSTLIVIIIILECYHERRCASKSPQEMDEDSNQPMQKYRCSYEASIRKNVSCGSVYNTETEKCTTPIEMHYSHSFQLFIFHISFSVFIRNAHCTSINECILSDCMYAQIINHCLVYFCVAFSRVLRN